MLPTEKKKEIKQFVGGKNKTSDVMSCLDISFYFAWNNPKQTQHDVSIACLFTLTLIYFLSF